MYFRKLTLALMMAIGTGVAGLAGATHVADAEARTLRLSAQLHCVVCQRQNIADSGSTLAMDLKNELRRKIQEGATNEEAIDFMISRYGDFVVHRPPYNEATLLLWYGPFALLGTGVGLLVLRLRRRSTKPAPALDIDDAMLARSLLRTRDHGARP